MAKPIMVVGTSAPRRRHIMKEAFESEYEMHFSSPDINEKEMRSDDARTITKLIATGKMDAVVSKLKSDEADLFKRAVATPGSVAVTFDQVVVWNGQIREKPETEAEAKRFILDYSDSSLGTVQTTCVYDFGTGARVHVPNETVTYYRHLSEELVDRVIARGTWKSTAGGFVVEDVDMHANMIKVDPGTESEVQGVCERTIREAIAQLFPQ